ncbi:MAG: class I SAM-dependent methyltransferase [Leptospiraceae bacterium]|jgi:SAM-dependent methyltransferase|nr:class I SAM-dependent methyltransferase [Leptospiraceae bacterium]
MAFLPSEIAWNEYYKNNIKILKYPDENLVRVVEKYYNSYWENALDFGCGTARHLLYLKEKNIPNLFGLDFSKEVIDRNKKNFPEIEFIHYENKNALPFKNAYFDLIICWGVLHYNSEEIRRFLLKEFRRILKPNGILIGTYRSKQDTHYKNAANITSEIYFFDENEIQQELSLYFKEIEIGFVARTPLGKLHQLIAHYYFCCKNF